MTSITETLADIEAERTRQDAQWGEQNHRDGTGPLTMPLADFPYRAAFNPRRQLSVTEAGLLAQIATQNTDLAASEGMVTWTDILLEEVFEALAEEDPIRLRVELIQVAAVAAQWAQAIDRRSEEADRG